MVQQHNTWHRFRGAADRYIWLSSWRTEVNGVTPSSATPQTPGLPLPDLLTEVGGEEESRR